MELSSTWALGALRRFDKVLGFWVEALGGVRSVVVRKAIGHIHETWGV